MRFTSLAVELIRARPGLVFWLAVLGQAALWFIVPAVLYTSPPGAVADVLAIGREYQLGSYQGPPLAFWLADVVYRIVGQNIFGLYLLAQACFVVTLWAIFTLARMFIGAQQAVLAVLLTLTITAFSFPGIEFGPAILARPLWALILLHAWQAVGTQRRQAWFALSFEAGLFVLTTTAALPLLGLLFGFMVATARGRRALASFDPAFALIVVAVLVLPYLVWLMRGGAALMLPTWPAASALVDNMMQWPVLVGGVLLALAGMVLIPAINWRRFGATADVHGEEVPVILRAPMDPFARAYIYFLALAPPLAMSVASALFGDTRVIGGVGVLLVPAGLAVLVAAGDAVALRRQQLLRTVWSGIILMPVAFVVVAGLVQPWANASDVKTLFPASDMGAFFAESYERRTGQRLGAVSGESTLAAVIALAAPSRPHVFDDAAPEHTPWLTREAFLRQGGVVVWRANDTSATIPDGIKARFPNLTAEVPRAFERRVQGRQPLLRIGWAIVRPEGVAAPAPSPAAPVPSAPPPPRPTASPAPANVAPASGASSTIAPSTATPSTTTPPTATPPNAAPANPASNASAPPPAAIAAPPSIVNLPPGERAAEPTSPPEAAPTPPPPPPPQKRKARRPPPPPSFPFFAR